MLGVNLESVNSVSANAMGSDPTVYRPSYSRHSLKLASVVLPRPLKRFQCFLRFFPIAWFNSLFPAPAIKTLDLRLPSEGKSSPRCGVARGRRCDTQMEALKRYRTGGEQRVSVTLQHVTVNADKAAVAVNPFPANEPGLWLQEILRKNPMN